MSDETPDEGPRSADAGDLVDVEDATDAPDTADANDTATANDTGDTSDASNANATTGRLGADGIARQRPIYTESQVIMTTVKVMIPFVLTYGLFITFHGADTPGGGFQGGAIIASVVLMIAFAFGIESTRAWLPNSLVVGLGTGGVLLFGAIGFGPIVLGGNFLEYTAYYPTFGSLLGLKEYEFVKYGMEAVEILGIAFIVSGILMGLFFALAAGFTPLASRTDRGDPGGDAGDTPVGTDGTAGTDTAAGSVAEPNADVAGGPTDD
jgi:multicomponent Na+:H+ antiporter subunit B